MTQLLNDDTQVLDEDSPAKTWVQSQRDARKSGIDTHPYFAGNLTITDQAGINNWFSRNIQDARTRQHLWNGTLPTGHARTLLLAHRLRPKHGLLPECPAESQHRERERFLLQKAWEFQTRFKVRRLAVDITNPYL